MRSAARSGARRRPRTQRSRSRSPPTSRTARPDRDDRHEVDRRGVLDADVARFERDGERGRQRQHARPEGERPERLPWPWPRGDRARDPVPDRQPEVVWSRGDRVRQAHSSMVGRSMPIHARIGAVVLAATPKYGLAVVVLTHTLSLKRAAPYPWPPQGPGPPTSAQKQEATTTWHRWPSTNWDRCSPRPKSPRCSTFT